MLENRERILGKLGHASVLACVACVALASGAHADSRVALTRVRADGSFDTDFGPYGARETNVPFTGWDEANGAARAPDDKIVVVGRADDKFLVVRYYDHGHPDFLFGDGFDGIVVTDFTSSSREEAFAVAIDADGKIVVAGEAKVDGKAVFALARYDDRGSLDTTFGGNGRVLTEFPGMVRQGARDLAISASGKIIVAGYAVDASNDHRFAAARYNADGSLDYTFGTSGRALANVLPGSSGVERAEGLAMHGDKIVLGGHAGGRMAAVRLNPNGSLDGTFSGNGMARIDFASMAYEEARDVAVDSTGRVVLAGTASPSAGDNQFALARLNAQGGLDASFDGDGKVLTDFVSRDYEFINSVTITPAGWIVVGGGADHYIAAARYHSNGALNTAFDGDGKVLLQIHTTWPDVATEVLVDELGRVTLVGYSNNDAAPL